MIDGARRFYTRQSPDFLNQLFVEVRLPARFAVIRRRLQLQNGQPLSDLFIPFRHD
jgi:hypothetical protein